MNTVCVIDYGVGNIFNVVRALKHVGFSVDVCKSGDQLNSPQCVVLPGVGAFGDCMQALRERGFIDSIKQYVNEGGFLLGICVGMHMLADGSEEFGDHQGLGLISGKVKHITSGVQVNTQIKVPHIAWSALQQSQANELLDDSVFNEYYYFVHSYKFCVADKQDELAITKYQDIPVSSIVARDNVVGVQFHPEKSGEAGLKLLKNILQFHFAQIEAVVI